MQGEMKMQKKMVMIGVGALVVALMVGGLVFAQPPQGGGPGGGQGGPGGFGGDPAQRRQMQMDMMMQNLGVEGDARKAIEPKLQKVMDLTRQLNAGGGGRGMFGGGRRGGGGDQGGNRPQQDPATMTPVEKAQEALRTALENESTSPQDIAAKLKDLRAAREKAKQELATAQEDLRKILTPRQEAQLVLAGQLN
jgi:hypothetical protein